jgi:hypothetical protein
MGGDPASEERDVPPELSGCLWCIPDGHVAPTLEEAKDQARFEFEIDDRDWVEVTDGSKA